MSDAFEELLRRYQSERARADEAEKARNTYREAWLAGGVREMALRHALRWAEKNRKELQEKGRGDAIVSTYLELMDRPEVRAVLACCERDLDQE